MRRREGRGCQPRHHRGQHQREKWHHPARQTLAHHPPIQRIKGRNQRHTGGKRQLKPRLCQAFRLPYQEHRARERHRPQAERAPIQQNRPQHHRDHQKGPLGRHVGPRQHQVKQRHPKGHDCRQLLGVHPQCQGRHQSQPIAQEQKDKAGEKGHVHARNRQKMRKVRIAQRLNRFAGNAGAVARHRTAGKGPGIPRQGRHDAARQMHSQPVDQLRPRLRFLPQHQGRAGITDRAQAVEKRHAPKVEPAGFCWPLGCCQPRGDQHHLPRIRRIGPRHQRDANPLGRLLLRNVQHHMVQRQPQSVRA